MIGSASSAVDAAVRAALTVDAMPHGRVFVAFSGGVDSTALLFAASRVARADGFALRAFHFDHRLHADSADWAEHCRAQCDALGLPCEIASAEAPPPPGASLEAWAREVRYAAAAARLAARDVLLTAHHRDDLAETVLLAALRGSGPHGLAAIAPRRALGAGTLLRPLLDLPRATLRAAVDEAGVASLTDPANADPRHDRSFLRTEIMPLLAARWPAAAAGLARAARLQRVAACSLDDVADTWLARVAATPTTLPLGELAGFDEAQATLRLRRWLQRASGYTPDARVLATLMRDLVPARRDATPCIEWHGGELRRHRNVLYWLAQPPRVLREVLSWRVEQPLALPGGVLQARVARGAGVRAARVGGVLTVRGRQGGERIRPAGARHSLSVKRLLQEAGLPPWERPQLPLILDGDVLLVVADLAIAADAAAGPGEAGVVFEYVRN